MKSNSQIITHVNIIHRNVPYLQKIIFSQEPRAINFHKSYNFPYSLLNIDNGGFVFSLQDVTFVPLLVKVAQADEDDMGLTLHASDAISTLWRDERPK